jgi:nitrogen fixation protein NifU and related proteins
VSQIHELYQQIILDHNRSPRNFRPMADATCALEGYNPLCGDHYTVYLKLDGETITDISFDGAGCAISKASASVMSQLVKGKTRQEAERLFGIFHDLVTGKVDAADRLADLGKLAAFAGVCEFPARVKCASLAWHTMHSALASGATRVTTE